MFGTYGPRGAGATGAITGGSVGGLEGGGATGGGVTGASHPSSQAGVRRPMQPSGSTASDVIHRSYSELDDAVLESQVPQSEAVQEWPYNMVELQ